MRHIVFVIRMRDEDAKNGGFIVLWTHPSIGEKKKMDAHE